MTTTPPPAPDHTLSPLLVEALEFQAPYVVERLMDDRIVASVARAEQLFTEVKRYLVMSAVYDDVVVGMCSARVDEAWHAFILYTAEYARYCDRYFGHFLGHAPKNAPTGSEASGHHQREISFPEFCARYEELFGELLPDVWFDLHGLRANQRVFNDAAGRLSVALHDGAAEVIDEQGEVLLSANEIAHAALEFVADTGAFYVRELPGGLSDVEKVRLTEALIRTGTLRLAP